VTDTALQFEFRRLRAAPLFALGFGRDAVTRLLLGFSHVSDETEPFFYFARLVYFGLIIAAIIQKNKPSKNVERGGASSH
jgi:hypothetical protein